MDFFTGMGAIIRAILLLVLSPLFLISKIGETVQKKEPKLKNWELDVVISGIIGYIIAGIVVGLILFNPGMSFWTIGIWTFIIILVLATTFIIILVLATAASLIASIALGE